MNDVVAALVFACCLAGIASGQERVGDRLTSIGGEEISGELSDVTAEGLVTVRLPSGETRQIALEELVAIQLAATETRVAGAAADSVWLRSGQALPARFAGGRAEGAALALWFARGEIMVPWRFVAAIRFDPADAVDPAFGAGVAASANDRDLVYAKSEDGRVVRVSADAVTIGADRVRVTLANEQRELPLHRVHGIVFGSSSGTRPDPLPKPRVRVTLSDGRRIAGKIGAVADGVCHLLLPEGVTLDIATTKIARIDVESDRLLELTDLTPTVEQVPALDTVWPPLVDQRPGGGEIRLGDRSHARGLVLVPFTRLTYAIGGRFDSFTASVGFEESASAVGEAVFRVRGDGQVLFDSGLVTGAEPPHAIDIPVTGVQELALEVDFGHLLDIGCSCVFASPRLWKK